MVTKKPRTYRAPALEKGLAILELLVKRGSPMSMAQIALEMGRSKNEIFRMLSVLKDKHYIERLDNGEQFRVTNRLFELGMQVPPVPTLLEIALPEMRQFSVSSQQACHLAVLSGHQIVVIARVESPAAVGFSVRVGHHTEIMESGSGKLFFAWMNDTERNVVLRAFRQDSRLNSRILKSASATIRAKGFASIASTVAKGITDICVPITRMDGREILASLAVPFCENPVSTLSMHKTIRILIRTGKEISRRLGSHGRL